MKKRIISALLAVFMLSTLVLAVSCGNDSGGAGREVRLNFATGGVAGTYYPFGGAIAHMLNDNTNLRITVNSTGASAANIQLIGEGDADIAIVQNDVLSFAYNGTDIWLTPPVTNIATLMSLYPETVHVIVPADSDIHSVADLAGRRVSIGSAGSGVTANATHVLAAYGLSINDITVNNLGFADSANAMRDRTLDAFFVTSAAPNAAVTELSQSRDLRVLSFTQTAIDSILRDHPYYIQVALNSSDYPFLTETIQVLAVQATLVASTDLDEQVAYTIVKTIIENRTDIGHVRHEDISLQNAAASISIPLHPGAERFLRESGALTN